MTIMGTNVKLKCSSCGHSDWYFDLGNEINACCGVCNNSIKMYYKTVPSKKRNRPPTTEVACDGCEFIQYGF